MLATLSMAAPLLRRIIRLVWRIRGVVKSLGKSETAVEHDASSYRPGVDYTDNQTPLETANFFRHSIFRLEIVPIPITIAYNKVFAY